MSVEMKVLGSREEWLQNRFKGIGGSEISAVIGCNPYLDNVTLWKIKTGRIIPEDISDKPYVKYGTEAEQHLRALFALDFPQLQVEYVENNSFHNDKYPWALASCDGWTTDKDGRRGILEIKTSEILSSQHKEKWNHQLPMNYYCQCLFYMAVLEAEYCDLKAQLKSEFNGEIYLQTKHYHIEKSEALDDIEYLMKKGSEFWEYVKADKHPPLVLPNI